MLKDRSTVEERGRERSAIFHSSLYNTKWGNAIMMMKRFAWPRNGHSGRLCAAVVVAALPLAGIGQIAAARTIENSTPASIARANDMGPAAASDVVNVTLWLREQSTGDAADRLVEQLYDPKSPNFHQWLSDKQAAALAPTAAQAEIVKKYLADHSLRVTAVDVNNRYVKAQGRIADVQKAMHVAIHQFSSAGHTFRSNTSNPVIDEPAGALVAAVGGLSDSHAQPHSKRAMDFDTGAPTAMRPLAVSPKGVFFSPQCIRPPEQVTFTTGGALPAASYSGNRYGQDNSNTVLGTLATCGYQPSELQTAYGLSQVYANGLDGTGETVVIVDAIGSPTIAADAELFSQVYGLPDLTSANFKVYYPGGQPPAPDTGWASETSLDVEWAHSVAPNASIALVIAPTANDSDLQAAILYAIQHHLGHVISNSYGEAESDEPTALLQQYNVLSRLGAAHGISVNFSSGDGGDSNPSGVTEGLILPGVSSPADSPWATGVGGTSLALDSSDHILFQTGWGNNETRIADTVALGSPPIVPPLHLGFIYGAGGGASEFFAKPDFQRGLPGKFRLVPDIAFLADPYTGVEFVCDGTSCDGAPAGTGPEVGVIGGTSLASPMFAGMWAIASQAAGGGLGQAARLLYGLPHGAIRDVVPVGSNHDVRGAIATTTGITRESSSDLAQPLYNTKVFYSALYNGSSTRWYVLTFGTDSSLTTAPGWDNVTGLGTPNGMQFIRAVVDAANRNDD
jgi:subtilase family serine protease